MRIRIKVYETDGTVRSRLDLSMLEEYGILDTLEDIEGFLLAQFTEIKEEGEE